MRIDPSFSAPCAAPGGGPPVARATMDEAAQRLERDGFQFQAYKGTWWPLSSKEWRDVDRQEGIERLTQDEEVHAVKNGQTERVLSQQDLLELDAFQNRNTAGLPTPRLAGSLAALAQVGSFQGQNGNLSTYEAYNIVLGDPNHERQPVSFVKNGESFPIQTPEDVQTAAWLIAGYGDQTGVAPQALQLKELKDLGYAVDPWKTYARKSYGASVSLTMGGQVLGSMPVDQLDPQKAGELCEQWKQTQVALGQQAGRAWDALQLKAQMIPFDQRLDAMKKVQAQFPETAADLYRRIVPGEPSKLAERVDQALAICARTPSYQHQPWVVFEGWHQYGESFPSLLERMKDPNLAARLARSLTPESEPEFYGALDDFQSLKPSVGRELALALADTKTLSDRGLVASLAQPDVSASDILAARDAVAQGEVEPRKKLFQAYRDAQAPYPSATRLLLTCSEPAGVEAYTRLRGGGLDDRRASALLEAMVASRKPEEKLQDLVDPALRLQATQPRDLMATYKEMRKCAGREEAYLEILARYGDPKDAAVMLAELPPEQENLFRQTSDALKAKNPNQGLVLVREAVLKHRLDVDAGRLEKVNSQRLYEMMVQQAPAGTEDAFLELSCADGLRDLAASWKAVNNGLPAEVPGRLAFWKSLPDKRVADRVVAAVPAGQDPVKVGETLAVLQAKNPKNAVESLEKIYQSKTSDLLSHLVRGGADLAEATEMARRVGRKDLPGAQLPQDQRCELVGRLGKLRGGNLQEGFQDYLFLATRLDDYKQIPEAVSFFATLLETGLSPAEARMAYAELTRREEMGEHQESVLKTYRFAPDLAGARQVLDEVVKLDPQEAAARLDQVVGRDLEGLAPEVKTRLAVGNLRAPLPNEGLDCLADLLGAQGLHWKPSPGWTVSGSLELDVPRGAPLGKLESAPITFPDKADSLLTFDASARQKSVLYAQVEGKEPIALCNLEGDLADVHVHLGALRGQKARLRLESTVAGEQKLELRNLKLTTTPTVGLRDFTLNDVNHNNGQLKEPITLSSTSDTEFYVDVATGRNKLAVDIHNGKDWARLGVLSGQKEEARFDLSPYRGQNVHLRLAGVYDGGWRMRPYAMQLREEPQAPATRSLLGAQSSAVADEILTMAFDGSKPADQRVDTVRALQRLGDDLEAAWKAWPLLEPHTGDADFEDRVEAVKALLPEAAQLSEVEQTRTAGESLASVARLRKGRSLEDFAAAHERIGWESQGEMATGGAVDFVGRVQARAGVAAADKAWEAVAPPIHDDSLSERTKAYLDLLEGCQGDGALTEQVYRKLTTWVEPSEGIQRACRAVVELHALVPEKEAWLKLIDQLQASQLEGRLEGVMLKRMSTFLIGKVTLEGVKLEEALKKMPEELQGKTGIEEREQHLVVGGTRLGRR